MCRIGNMLRRLGSIVLATVALATAAARSHAVEIPVEGRPADFTGVAGVYTMEVLVDRKETAVGEPIGLILRFRGSGPVEHQPARPGIDKVVEPLRADFDIEPLPERDRIDRAAGIWEFHYLVRPKGTHVREIPVLWFSYYLYRPPLARFVRRPSSAVPVQVRPRAPVIVAPPEFYAIVKGDSVLRRDPPDRIRWEWIIAILAVAPLMTIAAAVTARRLAPERAPTDQTSIEAAEAIEAIHACGEDDLLAMYSIACAYLQHREAEAKQLRGGGGSPDHRPVVSSGLCGETFVRLEAAVFGPPELAEQTPSRQEVVDWIRQVDRTRPEGE